MAKEYDIEVYSQKSLYNPKERTLKIYFDEPDTGVNTQTGILMLISGYGGNANSNVYKKMRSNSSLDIRFSSIYVFAFLNLSI